MMRAQKKFNELDADGNGVLEGPELFGLSEWVWSSFHPGGQPMSEEEKQAFGAKLLGRLDEDSDSVLSFDEFEGWFRRTCASIEKYRRGFVCRCTTSGVCGCSHTSNPRCFCFKNIRYV